MMMKWWFMMVMDLLMVKDLRGLCLIGRMIMKKSVNLDAMKSVPRKV